MKTMQRLVLASTAALLLVHGEAMAQDYPSKPIRVVVPVTAGSGTDVTARFVSTALAKAWGATVIVDNKPGAGSALGAGEVAKAAPDGYTLLFNYAAHYSNSWVLKTSFDPVKDFEPVARMANSTLIIATHPNSPFQTLRDLLAAAKARPGQINYGSAGIGSTAHMAGALLEKLAGVTFNHVPYKAASQVPVDASTGQVDFMFGGLASSLPMIKGGRLRVLAVTSEKRSANLPDVPTVAEAGVAGYENSSPIWMFAPRGTPQAIVDKLSGALTRIAATPEFKAYTFDQGIEVDIQTAAVAKADAAAQSAKWRDLVELTSAKTK